MPTEQQSITEFIKPRLVLSKLDKHLDMVLNIIATNSGESAFKILQELRKEFRLSTGSAYRVFRKLHTDGLIIYVPREPVVGGLSKIYELPSRYVSLNLEKIKAIHRYLPDKPWAKKIKIIVVQPTLLCWNYTGTRQDGKDAPLFYIKADGIYENPNKNSYLDLPQRQNAAWGVFKILRGYGCLK